MLFYLSLAAEATASTKLDAVVDVANLESSLEKKKDKSHFQTAFDTPGAL